MPSSASAPALVAFSSCCAFVGAAGSYTFAAHPGGVAAGPMAYTLWFNKMFPKVAAFQSVLVVASAGGAVAQAMRSGGGGGGQRGLWLTGAGLMAFILPWTFTAIMPVNKQIMAAADKGQAAPIETLKAWGPVHNVRTVVASVAAALMGYALYTM
ncbi:hypothetical protein HYH02_010871 [Chlamydomonas schloesseri]|uniref:DUF1772-domain-containing protein n=1 Tax=Chlamydomonas schloesseri TaxID=2026947 RepID=A0A835W7H6_9CHLO|nr:hypothetical protein HYH02_010871 [Chlamydomonas schloesseri]|eukprot:KAG2438416.1 hypothetical protein HYH02_010871 [Chlamydomonas schloesseri]